MSLAGPLPMGIEVAVFGRYPQGLRKHASLHLCSTPEEALSRTDQYSSRQQRATLHVSISLNGRKLKIQLLSHASHISGLQSPSGLVASKAAVGRWSISMAQGVLWDRAAPQDKFLEGNSAARAPLSAVVTDTAEPPAEEALAISLPCNQRGTALFFANNCMQCGGEARSPECCLQGCSVCAVGDQSNPLLSPASSRTPVTRSFPAEAWLPAPLLRAASPQI